MFKRLYYTSEILSASFVGTAIMLLLFIFDRVTENNLDVNSVITQSIIILIVYFIVFFIAYFFLVNPFYDFLIKKSGKFFSIIIILILSNVILMTGLYVDSTFSPIDVILTHYSLFLALNIGIIFFGVRKSKR